ncbi:MAG: nitroreductase [Proteobacteria bacterium]|jgi:nitroreductase|nr:nitroreductase [Pseudomonadota bacterium]
MSEMSLDEAVLSRRSVRGFLPKPVPKALMRKVFDLAQWSPSGTNVQPWKICVASGAVRDSLRAEFLRRVSEGEPSRQDHKDKGRLGEPYKQRRRDCARVLYEAMGIEWEDKAGRGSASLRNFELFDAPHVAFFCMEDIFGGQSAADVGMYTQTLMLAMTAHGLASCAQGTMGHYPDLVRETFGLEDNMTVLYGLSFGYEDTTIPANTARTTRAALNESVQFMGGEIDYASN